MFLDASFKKKHLQNFLKNAASISSRDVKNALFNFVRRPGPQEFLILSRSLTTSSIWISHSFLRYIASLYVPAKDKKDFLPDSHDLKILNSIKHKKELPEGVSHEQAYQALFHDIQFSHFNGLYQQQVPCPKIKTTLVLISGVFNEIFSTPAFARGAEYIGQKSGLKRISLNVSGTKGSDHNSELIQRQLETYLSNHKDEKLWIIAFSKGGVDFLHYLQKNPNFSNEYISGVSLMACPILGTTHLNHKAFQAILKIENLSHTRGFKFLRKRYDFLAEEFRKALSEDHQADWFKLNHTRLPKDLFYSALAFEAEWHQSHVWMMLTKLFFQSSKPNDGVVDTDRAQFPDYFDGINFGVVPGHHLIGTRSSFYNQEALLEAHLIYLNYLGKLN